MIASLGKQDKKDHNRNSYVYDIAVQYFNDIRLNYRTYRKPWLLCCYAVFVSCPVTQKETKQAHKL